MIIQNKRTGKRVYLTAKQYEALKATGYAGGWMIISRDDEPEQSVKKTLPKDIIDFTQIKKKKPAKKK